MAQGKNVGHPGFSHRHRERSENLDAGIKISMNSKSMSNAMGNTRLFRSLSYALVFLMMVCGAMTIGILIQNALPRWHSGMIAGIMLFIVIDRLYTYHQLKPLTPLSSQWAIA